MAIAATALLALALTACGSGDAASVSSSQVARGRAIYQANCATCHGANGEGQPNWKRQNPDETYPPPPHDASGHTWHHGDGLLFRTVRDGGKIYETPGFKSAMPSFGDRLSPAEIKAALTYIKTLWTGEQRAAQAEASKSDPFP